MRGMRDGGDVADSPDGPRLLYHVHRGQTVGLLSLQTGERSVVSVRCPPASPASEESSLSGDDHSGHSGHGDDDRRGAGGTMATAGGEGEGGSLCVVILEFPQSCYDQLVRTRPNVSLRTAWLTVSRLSPFFRTWGNVGRKRGDTHTLLSFTWFICGGGGDPPQH